METLNAEEYGWEVTKRYRKGPRSVNNLNVGIIQVANELPHTTLWNTSNSFSALANQSLGEAEAELDEKFLSLEGSKEKRRSRRRRGGTPGRRQGGTQRRR